MTKNFRLSEKLLEFSEHIIEEEGMKSFYFTSAIINRNRVRFLYGFEEFVLEPYYISKNKNGKKVLYARVLGSNSIEMFDFEKICNIRIISSERFSPIIPIIPVLN